MVCCEFCSWCYVLDISDKSLCNVARQIGHHWKEVGESLGVTQGELETLEYDNRFNLTARITNMLIQWRQRQERDPSDILKTLYSTFQKCGFEIETDQTIEVNIDIILLLYSGSIAK